MELSRTSSITDNGSPPSTPDLEEKKNAILERQQIAGLGNAIVSYCRPNISQELSESVSCAGGRILVVGE